MASKGNGVSGSSGRRAQGGGRTANSEPRLQVFKDFNGINFDLSARDGIDVDRKRVDDGDQTDLQMNYMYLQNNVAMASNKTMETRDDLVTLFDAPDGTRFTGPTCLIQHMLYAAKDDDSIGMASLEDRYQRPVPIVMEDDVALVDATGTGHTWTDFDYYDDKFIALTEENEMWVGVVGPGPGVSNMGNSAGIPDPVTSLTIADNMESVGLTLSATMTQECPYRILVAYSYVNMLGPTRVSPNAIVYASAPVSEWHAGCFLRLSGTVPPGTDTRAVELYYAADNAMSLIFLGRVDIDMGTGDWSYDWYGYVDATSMWPIANLIAPTENYTMGPPSSHLCHIDGRLYFWGEAANPQRLYIGGNPGNLLSVSPGTGGGFVDIEPGTHQEVRHVCKYKTQSGNSIVTMLCDSPNSYKEQRFNLVENTVSLSNEQSMRSWMAEQVAGAVGCKSYQGAVVCQDGLYSVSRYGLALTTMTMEYNSQIRTTYVSDPIKQVFTDSISKEVRLRNAKLLECDGVIYMAFGKSGDTEEPYLDDVLFCYDIDMKSWWTVTLDVDSPILDIFHVDWQGQREGIGIVTEKHIYMLPTTVSDSLDSNADHGFLIETAQLSTQMPQQGWQYLSQLEFHFDYLVGDVTVHVRCVDMFGRKLHIQKSVSLEEALYDYVLHMRIDQRVMSYVITLEGQARFRMTHFIARVYTLSNKVGQVWGFDDSISHRSAGSVHPTFKCYNDVRRAIFT